jgi:ArsR family metal-binding transcriptional regulator
VIYRRIPQRTCEDVGEKLVYIPSLFKVEKLLHGKWAYSQCEELIEEAGHGQIV